MVLLVGAREYWEVDRVSLEGLRIIILNFFVYDVSRIIEGSYRKTLKIVKQAKLRDSLPRPPSFFRIRNEDGGDGLNVEV